MDNSINFRGSFLIKQPSLELKNSIHCVFNQKKIAKQIIENISDKGDVLYVLRNSFDKDIADVIINTKNTKFKYYPTLNTKSGFDSEKPIDAKKILRSASKKFIDAKYKLENFFNPRPKKPVDIVSIQAKNVKTIQNKTCIDIEGNNYRTNINHHSGICSVYTSIKDPKNPKKTIRHTLISITPPDQLNISYARVTPIYSESKQNGMRRFAIKNGEVILEYNEPGSKTFIEHEAVAKKYYIKTMNKYKEDLKNYNNRT